jgi:hypothetical protein
MRSCVLRLENTASPLLHKAVPPAFQLSGPATTDPTARMPVLICACQHHVDVVDALSDSFMPHVFVACVASQLLVALDEARLSSGREAGLDAGARKRDKLTQLISRVGLQGSDTQHGRSG